MHSPNRHSPARLHTFFHSLTRLCFSSLPAHIQVVIRSTAYAKLPCSAQLLYTRPPSMCISLSWLSSCIHCIRLRALVIAHLALLCTSHHALPCAPTSSPFYFFTRPNAHSSSWQLRPSGYFSRAWRESGSARSRSSSFCLPRCNCRSLSERDTFYRDAPSSGLERVCEVAPQLGMTHDDGRGPEQLRAPFCPT